MVDIIVTAQRRVETAQRAAVAIDVVGGAQPVGAGVTQVATLGQEVPSLTVQQIGGSTSFFIRGVGNFSVSTTSDPAAAFNYDGVYIARLTALSSAFFDLDRVEVLKGPQGTLYGRNATAGVIKVLPTQPKIGELSGYGAVSYGNYNAVVAEGAINVPLGPRGAIRLSGTVIDHDGYLSNGISDDRTQALRVQMKVDATPDLPIPVSGDYTHQGGKGQGFSYLEKQTLNFVTGHFTVTPTNIPRSEGFLSPASQAFFTSLGAGPTGNVRATRDPFPDIFRNNDIFGANAQIDYRTGIGTFTIIPAAASTRSATCSPPAASPLPICTRTSSSRSRRGSPGRAGRSTTSLVSSTSTNRSG
ncbi:TonB-dependent receptor plug domain-containing protein [Sphingomonas bacterium]|uniref:TonB-dependent receptor plug domain-containing protein n=1 Tax=Sphingomonas bacterium TaxID=1895847 RepID=UPI0015756B3B|nr:TonB-dependent receptor plug domain-containing protein [Sphingomonas bacterium]